LYTWFGKNQGRLYLNGAKKNFDWGGGAAPAPPSKYALDRGYVHTYLYYFPVVIVTLPVYNQSYRETLTDREGEREREAY